MEWMPFETQEEPQIQFHNTNIQFQLADETLYLQWVEQILEVEKHKHTHINYIFCDDAYLLEKNQEYLDHDTLTDIITFEYSASPISGDIFISVERVKENAQERNIAFEKELSRVMAHGILHLCGYGDKKEDEVLIMRAKEEDCIQLLEKKSFH